MPDILKRKCNACKGEIIIDRNDIKDVVSYKNFYYHTSCFCELAEKKIKTPNVKPECWQYALDHLYELEDEAKDRVEYPFIKDDFNYYLINHYNVVAVPDRLWEVVGSLGKGIYKRKRCKPVPLKTLFEAWKWGQHKLDKIHKHNKMLNRGPKTDGERILYDLAILVRKIPNYLAYQAKVDAMQAETKRESSNTRINYNNIHKAEVVQEGLDDISALLDEF